jgi:hypothetical protein
VVVRGGTLDPEVLREDALRNHAMELDADGQIHFTILPGSVAKNRHLLDRTVA